MKKALVLIGLIALMVYAGPKVGDPAPDFTLPDSLGDTHSLSDFKGKVILLQFWQSFCPGCRDELPRLQKIYDDYHSKGLEVISVNAGDEWNKIKPLVRGYSYLVLRDNGAAWNKYRQQGYIPLNYVLDDDENQTVVYWMEGFNESVIRSKINSALPTGIVESVNPLPTHYSLKVNPTLFEKETEIRYEVPSQSFTSIQIYDVVGNLVKTLVDRRETGYGSVLWRGRGEKEKRVPQGVYFVSLETPDYRMIKKVVVLRR